LTNIILKLFVNDDKINNVRRVKMWNMFAKIYLRLLSCIFSVDVYFLCITLWTSREIIIETLNFPKSKMRDTTGDQLSIIWFVLLCAKCSSVMFDIIGKLRFWINTILTSLQIYRYTSYTSFPWNQKTPG
jgi:hypothetical protein